MERRAPAIPANFANRNMFLALRWCRATAKDDVFGWLRANAAIDFAVVSIACAAELLQSTMMHMHGVVGGFLRRR